jgi:hypothetical protein
MFHIPKVTMTMRELDRLKCIQGLVEGHLRQTVVATRASTLYFATPGCIQYGSDA